MSKRKPQLVLVGNGMAGVRLLEELLKRAPGRYRTTVFGNEPMGCYNRIQLSPVLAGEKTAEQIVTHPPGWYAERGIGLHANDPVVAIDRTARTITTASGLVAHYDRLVLATGSRPIRLPLPGADLPGVRSFRDLADVQAMVEAAARGGPAVVIGGGLLGLECAVGLQRRGLAVTVVHRGEWLMERQLDREAARLLQHHLEARGLSFAVSANTEAYVGEETVRAVRIAGRGEIPAGLVVVAAGVAPHAELARTAGLECGRGVIVDDKLGTSDPNVLAIGECAQHRGICYGLVAPLYEQARVCSEHLAADACGTAYSGSVLYTRLKVTGVELFSAGDLAGGEGVETIVLRDARRGIYKRLFLRDDRLVGAVLCGGSGDGNWYFDLIQRGENVAALRGTLAFGRAHAEGAGA